MCGIAGFLDFSKEVDESTLRQITEVLHHRGPDDTGYFFQENEHYNLGFGHKRLSIIDVSSCGHQPMHFEHLTIVYNGEVYNYRQIKEELHQQGYTFTSTSDTEVVLKAFHRWGMQAIPRFSGMFAIALYNQKTEETYLIRDRIGVKPLFYYYTAERLVFGSELKSIMAYPGFAKEINPDVLYTYLYHGYIPSPLSIFKQVRKVLPGSYITVNQTGISTVAYWDLKQRYRAGHQQGIITDEEEALKGLKLVVTKAVNRRMVADVPLGAFLSGGYDSSLVTAVMQDQSSAPVKTFTIGFHEPEYNEATYAYEIADYLKTDHYEKYLHLDEALSLVEKIPTYFDEPFADSSQLPTMLVSQIAREKVTVALSGDGGDEFFCGYTRYDEVMSYWRFRKLTKLIAKAHKNFGIGSVLNLFDVKYKKLLHLDSLANTVNNRYLMSQYYLGGLVKDQSFSVDKRFSTMMGLTEHPQEAFMLQDMLVYLPDDIMTKVDRATMSVGLEGREPLLDHQLIDYSFRLSHDLKYRNGEKKYILKQLTHQYIPKNLLDRPKKGFSLPVHTWLKNELRFLIEDLLSKEYIVAQGIFDDATVAHLLKRFAGENGRGKYTSVIWNLLVFQMWYRKYFVSF